MVINIQRIYATDVDIHYCSEVDMHYYSEDGYVLCRQDYGNMDSITKRVSEIMVNHNFTYCDVCSEETGEVLMTFERS